MLRTISSATLLDAQASAAARTHLVDAPIYFVTTCTKNRGAVLATKYVPQILVEEWRLAHGRHGWAIGRYVIMPDHVYFFCRPELDAKTLP